MASRPISPEEQRLALATKRAIQAAGGLEACAAETGLSTSQLSRCSSPHDRDSITIRDAVTIQAFAHGTAGHPHILLAMARQLGFVVLPVPEATDDGAGLPQSVCEISVELGDVARAVQDALASQGPSGTAVAKSEAEAALQQVTELEIATARIRQKLERIAKGEVPTG